VNPSRPRHVRAYLALVISLGVCVLAGAAAHWRCADPERFTVYLFLACLAGALKVRLPGMHGTYSLTFLFVLIGVVDLTFSETVLIATSSMLVQCVWRPRTRPAPVQVIFNAASASIAAAAAYFAARYGGNLFPFELLLAAPAYFTVNTLLVAGVLAQVEHRDFRTVWGEWFRLSLSYYLAGVVVAAVMIMSNRHFGWMFSLLALPLMYLEYLCYRLKIDGERDSRPITPSA
jgi:hypothetical protein